MNEENNYTVDDLINFIYIHNINEKGNNFYTTPKLEYNPDIYALARIRKAVVKDAKILLDLGFVNKVEIENRDSITKTGYGITGYIDVNKYVEYINKNRNK